MIQHHHWVEIGVKISKRETADETSETRAETAAAAEEELFLRPTAGLF